MQLQCGNVIAWPWAWAWGTGACAAEMGRARLSVWACMVGVFEAWLSTGSC